MGKLNGRIGALAPWLCVAAVLAPPASAAGDGLPAAGDGLPAAVATELSGAASEAGETTRRSAEPASEAVSSAGRRAARALDATGSRGGIARRARATAKRTARPVVGRLAPLAALLPAPSAGVPALQDAGPRAIARGFAAGGTGGGATAAAQPSGGDHAFALGGLPAAPLIVFVLAATGLWRMLGIAALVCRPQGFAPALARPG